MRKAFRPMKILSPVFLLLLSMMAWNLSCSKSGEKEPEGRGMEEHGMPKDWKFALPKGDPAKGREVFVEFECYKCHEVKGEKFPRLAEGDRGVGPELSQMAEMHPAEFLAESIIHPDAAIDPEGKRKGYVGENGRSKMPDYSDLLTVKQLTDLAAYLASLKGEEHGGH